MLRYFKRKSPEIESSNDREDVGKNESMKKDKEKNRLEIKSSTDREDVGKNESMKKDKEKNHLEIKLDELPSDPGKRKQIADYHPNLHDRIRRYYLQKGPCQPYEHVFPQTKFRDRMRRFVPNWFDDYKNWLEYSIEKDAAFCLCCYLYKSDIGEQSGGDHFTREGFKNWKKKDKFDTHVGGPNSAHNMAWSKCQSLLNQDEHIDMAFLKQSDKMKADYRTRLSASLDCVRFLLRQGLAFRGDDETTTSSNRGNFLELLHFLADHNDDIKKVVLENAPGNLKVTAPDIQKDISNALASEITKVIVNDVGRELFAILCDESRDASMKEQMAIVIRYVDSLGCVVERFLGIIHVSDTTSLSLKKAIDVLFSKLSLSISQVRGQGYDGASNMSGAFNGLKTLIMKENSSAYYIHCFAHQLQLSLVGVARKHVQVSYMYETLSMLVTILEGSSKRQEIFREIRFNQVVDGILKGELVTGRGLNQETSLGRASDTHWGTHFMSLLRLTSMYDSVIEVLEIIEKDGLIEQRGKAHGLLDVIQSFEFIFILHLMKNVMGKTNTLSEALQRKDQDIVNAMNLVNVSKKELQAYRENGWDSLFDEVQNFCKSREIIIPKMDDFFCWKWEVTKKSSRNNNPSSLSTFDKGKLISLAKFYPSEFSELDVLALHSELDTYIIDVRSDKEFSQLKKITDLSQKLVETKRDVVYPLVYMLLKLALILPVATATVERAFSAMNIVKNRMRNKMGDSWMNDCLITYIEKDLLCKVETENVINRYQNIRPRREQL